MIKYTLKCPRGHEFESWFANAASYDAQVARGQIACPVCGSAQVDKAIMAPAIAHGAGGEASTESVAQRAGKIAAARALRHYVIGVTEDVGARFPEEARRIAEGVSEERPIRGQATREEAKALREAGVAILPLPLIPEDLN
jgi:hypothetical protein